MIELFTSVKPDSFSDKLAGSPDRYQVIKITRRGEQSPLPFKEYLNYNLNHK